MNVEIKTTEPHHIEYAYSSKATDCHSNSTILGMQKLRESIFMELISKIGRQFFSSFLCMFSIYIRRIILLSMWRMAKFS